MYAVPSATLSKSLTSNSNVSALRTTGSTSIKPSAIYAKLLYHSACNALLRIHEPHNASNAQKDITGTEPTAFLAKMDTLTVSNAPKMETYAINAKQGPT